MSIILLQAWDKEKILSPQEELNFRPGFHSPILYQWGTETPW